MSEISSIQVVDEDEMFYKKLYEGIMSSIPSSIIIVDRHLRILSANSNFYIKSRRAESETLGKMISEIFPKVLLDYTKIPDKIMTVFSNKEPFEGGEMEYRAPGLPTRVYYYRLTPLENSLGDVESVILLMDDVTERKRLGERIKRTEEHLARVVESANDIIISTDPHGKIVSWNNTIEKITGLKSSDVMGTPFAKLLSEEDQKGFLALIRHLITGKKVSDREFSILSRDQKAIDVSWSFSAMKDEQGKVIGLVIVGRDLTERKALEARLIQSAKMASLGTMAGGIAHEIRNPLAIIDSSAQILKKQAKTTQVRNLCIEKIRNATNRAADIVDNLLKFARPSELSLEELDVTQVIDSTLALMQHQFELQHIEVLRDLTTDLPLIYGNRNQLQQVFMNLILNSCNALEGGGEIKIQTSQTDSSVCVSFKDNGIGIEKKYQSRIFDPFFTAHGVGKGTGLGLSISYGIIKQHNGSIEVKSQSGQGSEFTIKMPIKSIKFR